MNNYSIENKQLFVHELGQSIFAKFPAETEAVSSWDEPEETLQNTLRFRQTTRIQKALAYIEES